MQIYCPDSNAKPKLIVDGEHTAVVTQENGVIAAPRFAADIVVHTYSQLTETWSHEQLFSDTSGRMHNHLRFSLRETMLTAEFMLT